MDNSSIPPRQERKKKRIWPWLLMLAVFLIAAIGGAIFASSSLLDKPKPKPTEKKEEPLLTAHDKATIMIMGVDERIDDVGRSDTLMIATIDPDLDKAALLSIPRDTRVHIKGYGYDKINSAYAYGKEKLTQSTVENFLGINIDHYIIVNNRSFQKIIDALGGVDIDVEKRMYYEDPWDDDGGLLIDLMPGLQHMDGKTAITYVRYRDEEGDIGRIKRQQKFMQACLDKVTSPAIIPSIPSIVSEIFDSVQTDLSVRQLLEFAGTLRTAQRNGLETEMVPGRPLYIEGISYWIPDVSKLRLSLARTLGIAVDSGLRARLDRAAQEYEASIPSDATEVPETDTSIGRAVTSSYVDSDDRREERRERREKDDNRRTGRDTDTDTTDRPGRDRRSEDQADRNLDIPESAYRPAGERSSETPDASSGRSSDTTGEPSGNASTGTTEPAPATESAAPSRTGNAPKTR